MNVKERYTTEVVPKLKEEFGYKNIHEIPTLSKITLNVGLGKGLTDARYLETAENTLRRISGQAPVKTLARKSIAGFKIRQGNVIGMKVTLRGPRMWDFMNKLINVSLPRVRDFRGLNPKSTDGRGAYSLGFKEHIAFPEISPDEVEVLHGLQVTISTSAKNSKETLALLTHLGLPLKKD